MKRPDSLVLIEKFAELFGRMLNFLLHSGLPHEERRHTLGLLSELRLSQGDRFHVKHGKKKGGRKKGFEERSASLPSHQTLKHTLTDRPLRYSMHNSSGIQLHLKIILYEHAILIDDFVPLGTLGVRIS